MYETGRDAVAFGERCGIHLLPWQQRDLILSMGERDGSAEGRWAAYKVGLCVPRQNGKNEIVLVRQLYGLFVLPWEELLVHCAHLGDTSREAFRRIVAVIKAPGNEWLDEMVARIARSRGDEAIETHAGSRLIFKSRNSDGSGRGFTGDVVFLDEAMQNLTEDTMSDLEPTMLTRDHAQMYFTGSAADQVRDADCVVFARLRAAGHAGSDTELMWAEYKAAGEHPDEVTPEMVEDPAVWAEANPSLGTLIPPENIARNVGGGARRFATEYLNVGDWPVIDGLVDAAYTLGAWDACIDDASDALDPVSIAFDMNPRRAASIAGGGWRADGALHGELIAHGLTADAAVARLVALRDSHAPAEFVCDGASPAAALVPVLAAEGVIVRIISGPEQAQACGAMADAIEGARFWHPQSTPLRDAVRAAVKRPMGDAAWALSRKNSDADISPLVATVMATWSASTAPPMLDPNLYAQAF